MALERVPADIRRDGGVARMSDPEMISGIQEAVSIPVMAKARIGHFVEAQVLEALEVDYIDESEVLTPADERNHIDKWAFKVPFVCGATNLGEALRRIGEGAAMIRSKGEAGTGDIVEAVRHMRGITGEIRRLGVLAGERAGDRRQGARRAARPRAPGRRRRAPARRACSARGASPRPADAALMMALGAEGVFVGSGIFKSDDPPARARAIVEATTHWQDAERVAGRLARVSGRRWRAWRARSSPMSSSSPSEVGSAGDGRLAGGVAVGNQQCAVGTDGEAAGGRARAAGRLRGARPSLVAAAARACARCACPATSTASTVS